MSRCCRHRSPNGGSRFRSCFCTSGVFSLWFTAGNRAIQKRVSDALKHVPLGKYTLCTLEPGVDAIIALDLPKPYRFDEPEQLTKDLLQAAESFFTDMTALVGSIAQENA